MKAFLPALFIWVPSVNWHYLRILIKSTDFIGDYMFLSPLLCSHEICLQPFGDKAHQWTNLVFLSRLRIICICLVSEKNRNTVECAWCYDILHASSIWLPVEIPLDMLQERSRHQAKAVPFNDLALLKKSKTLFLVNIAVFIHARRRSCSAEGQADFCSTNSLHPCNIHNLRFLPSERRLRGGLL